MKFALVCVIFIVSLFIRNCYANDELFKLELGDLLFQDSNCGQFCAAINDTTIGYNNYLISHVGMLVSLKPTVVIEATTKGVLLTPLDEFLKQSLDESGSPRVIVGRLSSRYNTLIADAINYAESQIGKPYNKTFIANNDTSFYCSELIEKSFYHANQNKQVFSQIKMNFNDLTTGKPALIWQYYFNKLDEAIPQGFVGSNPGAMSRESFVDIVYIYGKLRVNNQSYKVE